MNITTQNGVLNTPNIIKAVYGDEITITLTNVDRDQVASNLSATTMKFAPCNSTSLLVTETASVTDNVATFTIDTSDLPNYGDYVYQVNTDNYTLVSGTIRLDPLIQ